MSTTRLTRPRVLPHSLKAFLSVPTRLLFPPPLQEKLRLESVLAGQHCSPLSYEDFEFFIVRYEHNAEVLAFHNWLRTYTAEYAALRPSGSPLYEQHASLLSDSAARARSTFLTPGPYELNLAHKTRAPLLELPSSPPPHPSVYDHAAGEVEGFLRESFQRWERKAKANAGSPRLMGTILSAVFLILVGAALIVVGRVCIGGSGGLALGAVALVFFIWLSIIPIIAASQGVCLLVFSGGGTVRQVSSFELALPADSAVGSKQCLVSSAFFTSSSLSVTYPPYDEETGAFPESLEVPHDLSPSPFRTRRSSSIKDVTLFWAPMTPVIDPIVIRHQWRAVASGVVVATVLSAVIGALALRM